MRIGLTALTFVIGAALSLVSYFVLAAPLGTPTNEGFSNPNLEFAPLLFVIGMSVTVLAVVVYEVLPDSEQSAD
ncbi:MAG: hypothetical protein HQ478_04840 [Chloroflexi bacterium]|nr:hypothetical protein [Chloroflexota bacterium]